MAEVVQTGGLKSFGTTNVELDPERKGDIRQAYAAADERKKKERRNKMIMIVILVLIFVGLGICYLI